MSQYDIYGIGAALVDTEIEIKDTHLEELGVEKGVMTLVDEARQAELVNKAEDIITSKACGGSAANSIIGASYFGSSTFFSCRVSNDDNGQLYKQDMLAANVSLHSQLGQVEGTTGKCLVFITPDAERSMNTYLGVSEQFCTQDLDESALTQSKYLYIEGYLVTSDTGRPAAIKAREIAQGNNVKVSLSLSDPAIATYFRDGMKEMVGNAPIELLFCNEAEAIAFTESDNLEQAKTHLHDYAKSYVITLGSQGAYVFDGNESFNVEAPTVNAIDTNGAGDMFAGAFLHTISQGGSYQQASEFAVKASAKIVSQFGPRLSKEEYKNLL